MKQQGHFHESEFQYEFAVWSDAHVAFGFGSFGEQLFQLAQAKCAGLTAQGIV